MINKLQLQLSDIQKEVLIGILLGDAHLETLDGKTYRLLIEQSIEHKDYVYHLYNVFKEFVSLQPKKVINF